MNARPISYPITPPENLPGFDVAVTVERMMGRVDLWWRVLIIFRDEFCAWEATWQQSQAKPHEERKCVHVLRSAAVNVGAHRLAEAAAALEKALLIPDNPALMSLRAHLHECFAEALQSVTQALQAAGNAA